MRCAEAHSSGARTSSLAPGAERDTLVKRTHNVVSLRYAVRAMSKLRRTGRLEPRCSPTQWQPCIHAKTCAHKPVLSSSATDEKK